MAIKSSEIIKDKYGNMSKKDNPIIFPIFDKFMNMYKFGSKHETELKCLDYDLAELYENFKYSEKKEVANTIVYSA